MIAVAIFKRALANKTTRMLQTTITNSRARIDRFRAAGLSNSTAEQTEINRIQAAVDILASRGFYDAKNTGRVGAPATTLLGASGITSKAWFKPAIAAFIGFVIFRKLL